MNEIFKDVVYFLILFLIAYVVFYLYTRHDTLEQRTARYDCNLTEFIGNVPNDVRDECRRLRLAAINNQKD